MPNLTALPIAAILMFGFHEASAAKCKYGEDSVDPFTKVKTLTTKFDPLTSSWMAHQRELDASIAVNSVDGELQLWVFLDYTRRPRFAPSEGELRDTIVVPDGSPLFIMMADRSTTKLAAIGDVRKNATSLRPEDHDFESNHYTIQAVATIRYELKPEAVQALSSQYATSIRITAANRNFDVEIHKKSFEDFQNAIRCIQK